MALVFDAGLQLERTALAWRRTIAAMLVGALLAIRILPEVFGFWTLIVGALGAVTAVTLLVAAHQRYRAANCGLLSVTGPVLASGGKLVFLTAALTFVASAIATVAVIVKAFVG